MTELEKLYRAIIPISRATQFRAEYMDATDNKHTIDFASDNSLSEWYYSHLHDDNLPSILVLRRLALLDEHWEPYVKFGNDLISLTCLKFYVMALDF